MQEQSPPFEKVLIANRGEIACRVIDTLNKMGVASVAIHHSSESGARFVGLADEACEIVGPTPVAAYLDAAQIIRIAKETGAQAIHPGYGFLSENAGFARQVRDAGLVFIGPSPDMIELMGDKILSRNFASAHGVPVAPSVEHTGDIADFTARASAIGFPLLIKASAGGGGRGMSIVHTPSELAEQIGTASSEAERYFGNGQVYAERYIERPRHIEVQVMGDGKGNVTHFFDRECSIQRRFQKIIEEAPSAGLPDDLRMRICDTAVRLAQAANYANAGTIEFILAPDGEFYFLEMNTRLQVEHPVSEMITGYDLVALQLNIAAGRDVLPEQSDVAVNGHSIECRICAEIPEQDFAPATGRVLELDVPGRDHMRFESGLLPGQVVNLNFDSMLAKLVVHGATRQQAIERMIAALDNLVLLGVETNTSYLSRIAGHRRFQAGDLHTGFLAEHAGDLARPPGDSGAHDAMLIAAALGFRDFRTLAFDTPEPHATIGHWRN